MFMIARGTLAIAVRTGRNQKLLPTAALRGLVVCLFFLAAAWTQAQKPAPSPLPQSDKIIVKLKPSLAHAVEADLSSTVPLQEMHVDTGKAGNPDVQSFMQRHSLHRLSPLFPQIIRQRQKHGWSDAQYADHLHQRFAQRAHRHAHGGVVPEVSRSYVLDLGPLSPAQRAQMVKLLQADSDVEFAEAEHTLSKVDLPNDPFLSSSGSWGQPYQDLWGLYAIGAPTAWNTAQGDGVIVAVVDTGLDYNHPDLAANVWTNVNEIPGNFFDDDGNGFIDDVRGWNFAYGNNDPIDDNGHGTHVAGTVAAVGNNSIGVIGVAWHAQVMAVKALDFNGNGFDSSIAPAIIYAVSNGADIINASWGLEGTDQTIEEAIQFADALGVVFVAAAGNSSEDAMNFFPASSPEAITVASEDPFGNFSFFSNFGSKIDATAPGENILSLQAANTFLAFPVIPGYGLLNGTSMAAPHVSGVAALLLSQNPPYSTEQVRLIIHASDTPNQFGDTRFGFGSLNAAVAVTIVNPLDVKITGVQFGATASAPITILGFAQGTGFSNYLLEFGQGAQPFFWTPFFSSVTPASGILGQLDPSNLFSGIYSVRLTAFNNNGNAFVDRTQFTVTFAQITNPPMIPSTYKPGFSLPIIGTADIPGFQNFTIQWAGQDGVMQTAGITLTNGGNSPVDSAQLATWDTSGITQAGFYLILLTVNGTHTEQASTNICLEPDLLSSGWPVFLDQGPCLECPVVPALNPDGTNRLLVGTSSFGSTVPAALWTLHADGSSQKTALNSFGTLHQPSAGSLSGLPGDDAVVVDFNVVDAFHPDGTLDVFSPNADVFLTNSVLVLADLNNDFQLESIQVGTNLAGNAAYLFAWQPDGQQVNGFPIALQENNNLYGIFNLTRVIAGDFAGDGSKEVLVIEGLTSTTYGLSLFNHDGTRKPFNTPILTGVPAAMAAADLDHNGKLETILVSHSDFLGTQATVHVFQSDGSERAGWPVDITASHSSFYSFSGIAVGDLNRDGHEEIVLSNGSGLYVFNTDGTLFSSAWPVPMVNTTTYLRPLIADINGDGFPEIVVPFDDFNSLSLQLRAFGRDASIVKTWVLTGSNNMPNIFDAAIAIGDFNQDGSTAIAASCRLQPPPNPNQFVVPGMVTILDTPAPFVAANNDWPLVLQNSRNNPVLLRPVASTLTVALTAGANPSVVGDALTFTATLSAAGNGSVQFLDSGTPISSALALSNGTASFTTSSLALGTQTITARYTGDNQHSAVVSPALTQNIVKGNSSIAVALTGGTNPALVGDTLTFTATVAPAAATGTVVFFDGATEISGSLPLNAGSVSFTTSTLAFGTHSISAQYTSDNNYNGSTSSPWVQTVNNPKADTSVAVALLTGTNPSMFGSTLTFSATVSSSSATGTVTFFDGSVPLSSAPLSSGTASFTTSILGAGSHSITAQYSGDANFNGSTSAAFIENVAKAGTQVELELAVGDTAFVVGTTLSFQATVSPNTATGSMTFFDGTTMIAGPIPLTNGSATFTTSTLSVGSHSIRAQYSGDANYVGSTSPAHPLSIKQP
ncbi:MAG TPA: Ig-like domain repeat protein [Candidatus Angelobacter sp.]|nr:Ig-like domain repeat protein [Candidatus Angelobacter sp.]